jgi:hypothetical protein
MDLSTLCFFPRYGSTGSVGLLYDNAAFNEHPVSCFSDFLVRVAEMAVGTGIFQPVSYGKIIPEYAG